MINECLICQVKALKKRIDKFQVHLDSQPALIKQLEEYILGIDVKKSNSPEITRNILHIIQEYSSITDPFEKEKQESNRELLARYDDFKGRIKNSENPFNTALRLAIAGNIIDFGPSHKFDVWETIEHVLNSTFAIDDSPELKTEIDKAKTILYIGDNCGELVLDKLFLETINHSNVVFAVREKPILNDATKKEAIEVGIPEVARLISNGDDTPSTLLNRVSQEFLEIYKSADVVISKGMGNFEGLMYQTDPRLFYLMMIKCPVIGKKVGAQKGDFVVKRCISK